MKKALLFTCILLTVFFAGNAQMSINTDGSAPHNSAILDIKASATTNAKGILMPRIPDHGVITNPAKGLMIFNTTTNSMWLHNGTAWSEVGSSTAGTGWILKNDTLYADNKKVGINTAAPKTTLEVNGKGLLVSQKLNISSVDPNLNQNNMLYDGFSYNTAAGILYDPSGPGAPYPTGVLNRTVFISTPYGLYGYEKTSGYKLTFEEFDTEANGDTLIILNANDEPVAKYSGNTRPPDFYSSDYFVRIQFKTNGNNIVGQGFKIKWQRLDPAGPTVRLMDGMVGNNLYFETNSGALRVGNPGAYPNEPLGTNSVTMGTRNRASGNYAFALGESNNATGYGAFAMGSRSTASGETSIAAGTGVKALGQYSTAIGLYSTTSASSTASFAAGFNTLATGEASTTLGYNTKALGKYSIAMGYFTIASSTASFAAGYNTTAAGEYTTAIGSNVNANNEGSMVIGDSFNGSTTMVSPNSNTFATRFRNGYYLYSNANSSTGVILTGGGNSWSTVSDSTKKENFLPIDGENILKKIAQMRTITWNYKGQDPKLFRHYGPMAQEFYGAFGRDKLGIIGNDTTIASADFDGINFTAIKALETRTSELQTENEKLKKRLAILEKSNSEIMTLKAKLERLEAFLLPEKEKIGAKTISEK